MNIIALCNLQGFPAKLPLKHKFVEKQTQFRHSLVMLSLLRSSPCASPVKVTQLCKKIWRYLYLNHGGCAWQPRTTWTTRHCLMDINSTLEVSWTGDEICGEGRHDIFCLMASRCQDTPSQSEDVEFGPSTWGHRRESTGWLAAYNAGKALFYTWLSVFLRPKNMYNVFVSTLICKYMSVHYVLYNNYIDI